MILDNELISYEVVTIQDCLDNYEMKDTYCVIENGQVINFLKEVD